MKKSNKLITISIIAVVLVLTSIITFNVIKKHKVTDIPEIMVSRNYQMVNSGDEKVSGTDYVTFDAFYLRDLDDDGYAEKIRGSCREIGKSDTLYMDLNVLTNGTLKNGKITINGKNINLSTAIVKDSVISQNYISENTREILLNDVNSGTQKLFFGVTKANLGNNINNYTNTENSIVLTGTHVADDGTETPINKIIYFTNDWYGITQTELEARYAEQEYDINDAIDGENAVLNVKFIVNPKETKKQLLLKNQHLELDVPELAGYKAIDVKVDNSKAVVNYDSETGKATIDLDSTVSGAGYVSKSISSDIKYQITYVYPLEAYEEADTNGFTLNIPIDATYTGYNNNGPEFENPYVSNVAEQVISVLYGTPAGENALVEIKVGYYVSDKNMYVISKEKPLNIYNNVQSETSEDLYPVRWVVSTGTEAKNSPIILNEPSENYIDQFMDINANYTDMTAYTKNVGIYFKNQNKLLGSDGYINVYNDETNELIHTFTSQDWNNYTENNPYRYSEPIAHIRVETSEVLKSAIFEVYNIKALDDSKIVADYDRPNFDDLSEIYSHVHAKMLLNSSEYFDLDTASSYAKYIEPYSEAEIKVKDSNRNISNQQTNQNFEMEIKTNSNSYIRKKWANGVFLIKYPEEIIDVDIKSIEPTDNSITITGYDTYQEDGIYYTKIYTSNNVEKDLDIKIIADITADPRKETTTRNVELYYYNPTAHNYFEDSRVEDIYDVNNNENTQEYVGKASDSVNIYAPSTLLTSQTATDFDDKGSVIVAPQEAVIDKENGERTANINVNITNNYSHTISEVRIVGKIPFEGNTYLLNGADLGSMYDTQMTDNGIVIPEELKPYATVYYSEKENVTQDINARKNGWTTTPADMSKIKSYLIDLGDYVMPVDNTKTFTYTVKVPSDLNYNDVSYADHAVYFCLDTTEGKLNTQTEPNKLGIKIALKYDLEITKYQKNKTIPIAGVVFSATDTQTNESKTATTYSTGIATIKNLYVEKEYVIKEIKTNDNYILDNTETKIIAHVVNGHIQVEVIGGNFKTTPQVVEQEEGNDKIKTTIENEVKYNFELDKTQLGTDVAMQGIRFELTDFNDNIKRLVTNSEGKLVLTQLEPNKQYRLTEIDSKGHYVKDPVTFTMVRDGNNNLQFNVIAGELDSAPILDLSNEIPVVKTRLVNEKIPTYSLKITKKESETENTIQGTQFKLEGENKSSNTLYTTNENGEIIVSDLYNYVEGKNITGEYTLTEIYPGEGYILNDEPVRFKLTKNGSNFNFDLISGNIREEIQDVQIDTTDINNPIVNITIDNDPVFTLTKLDAQTGEPLEGVTFEFKDINGNSIIDANGKLVGYNELTKINFTSGGNYPWTQNEDGTWQSGNYNQNSSTSTLTSDSFTFEKDGVLSFEWSASSESYSDYLYYTITNVDTGVTIGGTNTRISDTTRGLTYENLKYDEVVINLEKGTYTLVFSYVKDNRTNKGLDSGFVKDVKATYGERGIKTDSNGKIRLSLTEGIYKAIETETLEGYELPEGYTGIGIGSSQSAKSNIRNSDKKLSTYYSTNSFAVKNGEIITVGAGGTDIVGLNSDGELIWRNTSVDRASIIINGDNNSLIVQGYSSPNSSKRVLIKLDDNLQKVWETSESVNFDNLLLLPDGILGVNYTGTMTKFDFDGNLMWVNSEINSNSPGTTITDRNTIAMCTSFNFYEFDLNGNKITEFAFNEESSKDAIIFHDKVYIIKKHGDALVYDMDGNLVDEKRFYGNFLYIYGGDLYGVSTSSLYKINENEVVEWSKSINDFIYTSYSAAYSPVHMVCDEEYIYLAYNTGDIAKYNMNGERVWVKKTLSNRSEGISKKNEDEFNVGYYNGIIRTFNKNLEVINEFDTNKRIDYYEYFPETNQHLINNDGSIKAFDEEENLLFSTASVGTPLYDDFIYLNGNYVYTNSNGKMLSFDTNGNILWTKDSSNYSYKKSIVNNNEMITISNKYNDNKIVKYDSDGNIIWEKNTTSSANDIIGFDDSFIILTSEKMIKYDYDGNIIWEKAINDSTCKIQKFDDGFIIIHSSRAIVYNLDGKEISNMVISNGNLYDVISYDDMIIGTANDYDLVKFERIIAEPEIVSSQNVIVYNDLAKYKVITKVDGVGGSILGQNEDPYETVIYKEDSTKDIIATPAEGFKVSSITINGEPIDFTENLDGTVTLNKFYEMTEDKEVIVSFVSKNKTLVINKVDSTDNSPLSNAKFNIIQLDTRENPNISTIAGSLIANGQEYINRKITLGNEITGVLGNIENKEGAEYYFTQDGTTYIPNNSGAGNTTANSYFKIDLESYTGDYSIVVNANVSSEGNYDFGYATITDSTNIPSYSTTNGRFINISGNTGDVTTPQDYTYYLEGGKTYYLHIGYKKDGSGDKGDDKFFVNGIKVCNAIVESTSSTYNFIDNGHGGYESNNQGKASTTANSYIPLDLTGYSGKYNLVVNANVSSQSGNDYGYATITSSTNAPQYNDSTGRFIYISGTNDTNTTPTDYSTVIEGGKMYYLHFGYRKNDTTDNGEDKFTINSINITLNQDGFIDTEIETNSSGQASIELPNGRYKIVEVKAPEGYTLITEPVIHDFVAGGDNEITFRNNPQTDLIVHHYIKGTTTPVADDEYIKGDIGKEYSTSPKTDLERYQLEEDGNGGYILPDNASGTFTEDTQVVTYYYVLKPLELIVHHYIDGTQESVVPDEHSEGVEGQSYTTNPATAPELDEKYELVETKLPENANGTLTEPLTEVTYYYKVKEHIITTEVDGIGGTISGQEQNPYEVVSHGEDSVKDIIAEALEGYQIESITINGDEISLPEGKITSFQLDKFINMTEDKHIVVKFQIERVNYKITKVWEDNNDEAGKRPEQIEIQLYNGSQLVNSEVFESGNSATPAITFSTMSSTNPWAQNPDGTWQSGNYNIDNSTSVLTSDEFEISEGLELSFDWSASSESESYDYLYYTLTNVDTGAIIGGTSTKIGGTSYGTEYDSLNYTHVTIELEPGKYIIEFTYRKDSSVSKGLDEGFVKNIKIETGTEASNRWQKEFNVPLLDSAGNRINYTVVEKEVNTDDLYMYNENTTYGENEATIINTFEVPQTKVNIEATKVWDDNSNENSKRPSQIKLQLKNGSDVLREQVIDVTGNSQTYTFDNLDEFDEYGNTIPYTIDEVEVNTDDLKFYSKQVDQTTYTITNTFTVPEEKTSLDVTKVWSDDSNVNSTRPAQIKLQVKNGNTIVQEQVVNVDNTTNEKVYTFENLALYDSTGEEIVYTVDELEVNENDLIGYTKSIDGNTITNTIIKHKITTEVNGQGGTISGENEDPYEEVNHKGNSVKDVVITPEPGYIIKNITINDEPQDLPEDAFSEYTLDKFEEMTEDKHIVVEFELVEHVITTEVEGVGGTISGQGSTKQNPYETVIHGNNSTKDIVVTPDSGYKITSITVNGNAIEFAPQNDGTYTLPIFENMTEDKHVVVKFERKETSVVVKHQTEDGTDLVDPETIPGRVGDEYTTEPKDFPDYDLKTTPDNAEGNMAEEQIEVIYVYSKVKGTVTVTKVDKTDNSILLEGAVFKLEKLNDSDEIDQTFEAREERTNTQGKAVFEDLEVGKYRLTEIQAPQNYELTNEVVDVEVTKAERDVSIVAQDRMKIVLPATGKINYSIVVTGIGLVVIATAFILKKKDKKASQE